VLLPSKGGFPPFHIPSVDLTWANFILILPYAVIVAGVRSSRKSIDTKSCG